VRALPGAIGNSCSRESGVRRIGFAGFDFFDMTCVRHGDDFEQDVAFCSLFVAARMGLREAPLLAHYSFAVPRSVRRA
jgi:hypothetical protein